VARPAEPGGPYIQRDGMTNPGNFVETPAGADEAERASSGPRVCLFDYQGPALRKPCRPSFAGVVSRSIDPLKPEPPICAGDSWTLYRRGIGIIDTIHLVEVARAIEVLKDSRALSMTELDGITQWFTDYLQWMTTSKNGLEEREAKNNHGTCWVMQVAAFAHLTGDQKLLDYCLERFKTVIVPNQIAADGSFPQELRRTKPYGYSLFNLDAMATICQILSTPADNLWTFEADGRGIRRAMAYMFPFIRDKKKLAAAAGRDVRPRMADASRQFVVRGPGT